MQTLPSSNQSAQIAADPDLLRLAAEDLRCSVENGVDLNPFSTESMRYLWQMGFDGKPLRQEPVKESLNWRAWERGRIARLLMEKATA